MKTINIGVLGFGTVGTGVAKMLIKNKQLINSRIGAEINLKYIADIDIKTDRGIALEKGILLQDARKVVDDPDIDIIIETIGGQTAAKELILRAVENGKHIVTANKALLAEQGKIIFQAAADKGVGIAFEASAGGCIPIIKTIRESLVGNNINSITGILNGTCNYILSQIADAGCSFEYALKEAQIQGYAEANPEFDIQGIDTAHKLAILTSLAYGTEVDMKDIFVEGIDGIAPIDMEFARQFGYRIKLLAVSKYKNNTIEARVHPAMISFDNILSNVSGTLNAVTISGDAVDDIMLNGHGAGMMPTASAIVGDTADLARNLLSSASRPFHMPFIEKKIPIMPIQEVETRYYMRFSALDRPGVLSKISGLLGEFDISLKSVHQKGREIKGCVPIVMLTHEAKEAHIQEALNKITGLDIVCGKSVRIRIEH